MNPTATSRPIVWFHIQNVTVKTLDAFGAWQLENDILPMHGAASTGPVAVGRGRVSMTHQYFSGGFDAADADRVTEWLEAHGIPVEPISGVSQ